jgi:hypothetical protein
MAFPDDHRHLLLGTPGIGPRVLQRLEAAGFHSLAAIHAQGVDRVIERVARQVPGAVLHNRRGALQRALAAWSDAGQGGRDTAASPSHSSRPAPQGALL